MKAKKYIANSLRITAAAALVTAALYPVAEAHAVDSLQRYCSASWRNARISEQDWGDCTQQAIERLLERVSRQGMVSAIDRPESPERRELNRAIWCTVQRWRRAKRLHSLDDFDVEDSRGQDVATTADSDDSDRLRNAMDKLSPIQRQVLTRWSEGAPVREIAAELDLTAARVSDHKYKAVQKLRRLMGAPALA